MNVRAVNAFSVSIADPRGNSSNCYSFAVGEVISYGPLVERLKELGAPIVDEADETMMICPQCRSWCNTVDDRVTATMVLRNAGLPMDGQFFSFRIGDLIQHAPLIAPLRADPLRETTGIQSGSAATQQRRWTTSR